MAARTIQRYLARQIYAATAFVLAGFLALFAFFDLVNELGDLGVGDYNLREILTFVLLTVPAHAYELFPVVVLIGTLYVLAYLASNSEYTVMRAADKQLLARGESVQAFTKPDGTLLLSPPLLLVECYRRWKSLWK